jgi:spore photoproduct lyase
MTYRLYAEADAADSPIAQRVARSLALTVTVGPIPEPEGDRHAAAKKTILLANHRGDFLKPCPGTRNHTCCGYRFLNIATNCPIDCTYCILQDYVGAAPLTIHCNLDDMYAELEEKLSSSRGRVLRIGTGELTDSLAVDELTGYAADLVPFFAGFDDATLELKTKTAFVRNIVGLDHRGRTVIAWSLNPDEIAASDEKGAASVDDRIAAARRCQDDGYPLAFHFDPLIEYPGWREGYRGVVQRLFDAGITQESVAWISMGTLRYPPHVGDIIAERFPRSVIRTGELVSGIDGKRRYFKPVRIEMYRELASCIARGWPDAFVYLCMESPSVWRAALGREPDAKQLSDALDDRTRRRGAADG